MLQVKNVNVYEGKQKKFHILKNISLNIKKGEFLVILGKSGSGKSTLLNVLGGIEKPESGVVLYDESDVYKSDHATQKFIYNNVGFVFQNYNLIDNLTAYENIELAVKIRKNRKNRNEIEKYFEMFEIKGNMNKLPYEMSGGEQQRVSVIRTLVLDPEILLCDEPTGALDSASSSIVIQQLQNINRNMSKTIVMVTHDESYVEYADRVIHIKDGDIEKVVTINDKIHL